MMARDGSPTSATSDAPFKHARRIARAIIRDTEGGTGQPGQEVDPT
jgi:hypothetical protein